MVRCPFGLCKANVDLVPTHPKDTLKTHQLDGPPRLPTMNCPASLMEFPLSDDAKNMLLDQYRDLARHLVRDVDQHPTMKPSPGVRRHVERLLDQLDDYMDTPHDIGKREPFKYIPDGPVYRGPEPGDPAWQVGGREDEEIIRPEEVKKGRIPLGVLGQGVGRGSGMASMSEVLAQAASAINACDVAAAGIGGAKHEIQRARQAVAELLGESQSGTLQDWMANLNAALDNVEKSEQALLIGKELGETFSRNVQA